MVRLCTLLLAGLLLCMAHAHAQGRRIRTFPYTQPFTWITAATNAFPTTDVDGGEFTLDAGTTGWTTTIVSHGLNNNGGSGGAIRVQTTATVNGGAAGLIWYGDLTGCCADTLTIDWSKATNGAASTRVNELRIATSGGGAFTDLPLANVAGSAWPGFDNSATPQSGTLRVRLPASLGGASDVRIRIYSINIGGTGSQPRVVLDNLTIAAPGAPVPGAIDSIADLTTTSMVLYMQRSSDADSILVLRRTGAVPVAAPRDGARYAPGDGLNESDTVLFAGPAATVAIASTGLQPSTIYGFSVYGFRSCNARYSAFPVTGSAKTIGGCGGAPATITNVANITSNQSAVAISFTVGARTDSVMIVRRRGSPPTTSPVADRRYRTGEGLNDEDTVAYVGPPASPLALRGLAAGSLYYIAIYGMQSCNGAYSAAARDTVRTLPSLAIIAQPAGGAACIGESFTFSVATVGPNVSYQWRKDGNDIAGATSSIYRIDAVTLKHAGNYDVHLSSIDTPIDAATPPGVPVTLTSNQAELSLNTAPAIITPPRDQTLCRGSSARFTVVATGSGLAFQWRHNGEPITGATSATFTIDDVDSNDAGFYDVMIRGACVPSLTTGADLAVSQQPVIIDGPHSQGVCPGEQVVFHVKASGSGLAYQWRKDGKAIAGAVHDTYTVDSMREGDVGTYDVIVSGTCTPAATSVAARLAINTAPIIAAQPLDQTVLPGAAVTFIVGAYGSGTLRYQWRRNGVDIPGATTSACTIRSVAVDDVAGYSCVIGNDCTPPMTVSNSAWLFVRGNTSIIAPPGGGTVCAGDTFLLRTTATGTELRFQWRKDGRDIAGGTRPELAIQSASRADGGSYQCVVTSRDGTTLITPAAEVTVLGPPVITKEPADQEVCSGDRATFDIAASGVPAGYQWRRDGKAIDGAIDSTYSISSAHASDTGAYDCVVSSSCGSPAISKAAALRITPGPMIVDQPVEQRVSIGEPVLFRVVAAGKDLTYEWRHNSVAIPGANAPVYSIAHTSVEDAGVYDVLVNGCSGLLLSRGVILRVDRIALDAADSVTGRDIASMIVAPNPVDGIARIELRVPPGTRVNSASKLVLYDLFGRLVIDLTASLLTSGGTTAWLDAAALPSGNYYCRLETPKWRKMLGVVMVVR